MQMEWLLQARPLLLRFAVLSIALPMLMVAGPAHAQTGPSQSVTGPEINALIRTAIIAVHHANISGNYTVLHDISARSFRDKYGAADLGDFFRSFREKRTDLSQTVLIDPILKKQPQISSEGVLTVAGHFPAQPLTIYFNISYVNEEGFWKISDIGVGVQ